MSKKTSAKSSDSDVPMLEGSPPKKKQPKLEKTKTAASDIKSFPLFATSPKPETSSASKTKLVDELKAKRAKLYESVLAFTFNKKRVRPLSSHKDIPDKAQGILYHMTRDQRVQDNWSLLYAQKIALKQELQLHVCFCLQPTHLGATYRHYYFMLEGLKQVEKELRELKIPFHLLIGPPKERIPEFVKENRIGGLVCDFSPLRVSKKWLDELIPILPSDVPIVQVDAHNIVPCWHASDKLEYAARTIRNKINSKLDEFLTEFPPVVIHKYNSNVSLPEPIDWATCYSSLECDKNVKIVDWAKPGYEHGIEMLESFLRVRIKAYETERNEPNRDALSNLSPWYHFGQVSVQRCILEVKKYSSKYSKSVQAYMEETIVRRELSDNFCYYQPNYDNLEGANDWAKKTLSDHAGDKRQFVYTLDDLDNFRTHDRLWNAAQIQIRVEGKMHGFLRMYWAKKILEWSESPAKALEYAIYLNDRYGLDGRDPSGYVGCMWSICGIHDQGWAERPVYGKIRCMTYDGCKRKFDVASFEAKYMAQKKLI